MKRALCIWLPQWPLQRIAARDEHDRQTPVVLYQLNAAGGARVTASCPRLATAATSGWLADRSAGIRPGMPLAEATALARRASDDEPGNRAGATHAALPGLHLEAADPWGDRRELEALADDCLRFAPTVGIAEAAEPDSLLLDVTGIGDLSGGEAALARRIVEDFRARRLSVRVALADTPGAAWAVAHFAPLESVASEEALQAALAEPLLVPAGETAAALAALPPAALRLAGETCGLLAELGVRRIEQLAALPRETLLARFGPLVLLRLDQALGTAAEAIVARAVPPEWTFEWPLQHPTGRLEMIEWVVEQLVARVCTALARQRRGVLRLACRFIPERGAAVEFVVGLYRPSASERHVGELVRLKLETVRFREPLSTVRFEVLACDLLEFQQQDFFGDDETTRDDPRALATLVDRLSNRLGAQAVARPWLLAGAQPEFACQYRPVASLQKKRVRPANRSRTKPKPPEPLSAAREPRQPPGFRSQPGDRPLWLEPQPLALAVVSVVPDGPPVMFRLAGSEHRVARSWGPERIETGWWRTRCVRRDYYQVETRAGARYWLFRELNTGRWYLHGTFI